VSLDEDENIKETFGGDTLANNAAPNRFRRRRLTITPWKAGIEALPLGIFVVRKAFRCL